jgi:hypothetical protein
MIKRPVGKSFKNDYTLSIRKAFRNVGYLETDGKWADLKKRPAKGARHRAQGKASAQAKIINVPFRAPYALRLAPCEIQLRRGDSGFPTASKL